MTTTTEGNMQPLPLPMTAENLRSILATFRALPGALITIKPALVEVTDPRGAVVFRARRAAQLWNASARAGLITATWEK